ncbi:MAG: hypothetical protein PHR77_20515 [Kiritimatiellae bacterium]|nr:hypothetical protein [Kiritimatiellia bacterium]MDD5520842.1 hypothetical protein [Kiritimatiellia bacterium]
MSQRTSLRFALSLLPVMFFLISSPISGQSQIDKPPLPVSNIVCDLDKGQQDLSVWPNSMSSGNSDPWIWQNHIKIRKMRPRVMVLNFGNSLDMDRARKYTENMINNLANSSRYHGYSDPGAPVCIEYQVIRYVDLRDNPIAPSNSLGNSMLAPYQKEALKNKNGFCVCDYSVFYSKEFARYYGFVHPSRRGEFIDLHELINSGIVHELWFFWLHGGRGAPLETVEYKRYYDENCRPIPGKYGPAGNGHCKSMPWSGRSFRITFFNPDRGLGCGMENFCHALEGMANYNSIGYYKKYFYEFAEFDLNTRYKLPGKSLYAMIGMGPKRKGDKVEYPTTTSMKINSKGNIYDVADYIAAGGNVHFPPGARGHYDQESPFTVKSTIENYRLFNGSDGKDKAEDFNKDKFKPYRKICPDGMGPWLMYWRQNFPGLDNKCKDDQGQTMKNWWPFLFY